MAASGKIERPRRGLYRHAGRDLIVSWPGSGKTESYVMDSKGRRCRAVEMPPPELSTPEEFVETAGDTTGPDYRLAEFDESAHEPIDVAYSEMNCEGGRVHLEDHANRLDQANREETSS